MHRHGYFTMICLLGAAAIGLPLSVRALLTDTAARAPESLTETVDVVSELGLYHRFDGPSSGNWCLIVSERALPDSPEQSPRINNPSHPFWIGTVAIYRNGQQRMSYNYDPACSVVWGTLFVYGDPDLIEKLSGHRP